MSCSSLASDGPAGPSEAQDAPWPLSVATTEATVSGPRDPLGDVECLGRSGDQCEQFRYDMDVRFAGNEARAGRNFLCEGVKDEVFLAFRGDEGGDA